MAKINGASRKPGRPPAPRYNLEKNPANAIGRLVGDAMDAADRAEASLRDQAACTDLTRSERLLVTAKIVELVRTRASIVGEAISAFGKRRSEVMLEPPSSAAAASGSPFLPDDTIPATVNPTQSQEPL